MKVFSLLFLLLISIVLLQSVPCVAEKKETSEVDDNEADDGALIQENPDYEKPVVDMKKEEDPVDEEEEEEAEDDDLELLDKTSVKGKLAVALKKSRKRSKKFLAVAKKHRRELTLVVSIFAFRREIRQLIMHLFHQIHQIMVDPETGKLKLDPTAILKLILFVNFVRQLQYQSTTLNSNSQTELMFQLLASSHPIFKYLISKIMTTQPMYNPARLPPISQQYMFERLNERYIKDGMALHKAIHSKHTGFKWPGSDSSIMLDGHKPELNVTVPVPVNDTDTVPASSETVIVLDWTNLDTSVSQMEVLRDQISFLLSEYRTLAMTTGTDTADLEVVALVESPGGSAADFGLAARQLLRLRDAGILLTVCVDKVAASGGYMVACTSSPGRLFAAPFAVLGSIGVIGQTVNIHKLLEGWGVSPLVFRGGKDKAPVGLIGEITPDGMDKVQHMVDATHKAFRHHVASCRSVLADSIEEIGTGDTWLGLDALEHKLIDRITTSDEYLGERITQGARVVKMIPYEPVGFFNTLTNSRGLAFARNSFSTMASNAVFKMATAVGMTMTTPPMTLGIC
jgi:ClpP class serine protease